MIEKERLQELIEQGATIYMARAYTEGIYLMPENFEVNDKELVFKYKLYVVPLEDLFETEEDAKWFAEFGCIERTIKLDLPKWEDIEKDKNFHYIRHFVITKNFSFFIEIYKFTNTISVSWSGGCKKTDPRFDKNWQLTKENYLIACRKAKELFLGEKK